MRFVLESAKKDATKYTRCIQWLVKRPKKERGNRKLLPPSNRSQPINEINYGHQSFTYKEFCALLSLACSASFVSALSDCISPVSEFNSPSLAFCSPSPEFSSLCT